MDMFLKDSEKRPEIRCRVVLNRLKALEIFEPSIQKKILSRLSAETDAAIHSAGEDDWIPIEYNIELSDCVAAETGEKGIFDLGVKGFELSIKASFIAPFIRAALALLKTKPNLLLRLAPQFYNSIHRNCGELSVVQKTPGHVDVHLEDMPLVLVTRRNFLVAVAAFIQAFSPYSGVKGSAVLEQISEKTRSAVIAVKWETK
jgi:hypothetical protein